MEEQKKEELSAGEETAAENSTEEEIKVPVRSYMLRVLAGIYLVYTGYRLCRNVIEGVEGASWGFMLAGIAFLAIGGVLAVWGLKGVFRDDRERKAREAAEKAALETKAAVQDKPEKTPGEPEKTKMSIADRAKLVKNLEDGE